MKSQRAKEIRRARRKVSFRIAEELSKAIERDPRMLNDLEGLAKIVAVWLPLSNVEAEAEMERLNEHEEYSPQIGPKEPSVIDRLRTALGYDDSVSLKGTIEGAIDFINRYKGNTPAPSAGS